MGGNIIKRKKELFLGIIIIILIAGFFIYFKQLKLDGLVNKNPYIIISYQEFGVKNGSPYINDTNYNEITEDEKSRIADLLKQYSYKRTFGTIFSNGSMSNIGEELVIIYTYDENNNPVNTISIASSDDISVNGKNYMIKNSSSLINELIEIIHK